MRDSQKESLLNEYKGNLFEYLVAHSLAQKVHNEKKFLLSLNPALANQLKEYQTEILKLDTNLYNSLPKLASTVADYLKKKFPGTQEIELIGKLGAHPEAINDERDILLLGEQNIPISLKLLKKGGSIHTKSAGAKSLFAKYFSHGEYQEEFNSFLIQAFENLAVEFNTKMDLAPEGHFEQWKKEHYPELPGELSKDLSTVLKKYYHLLIEKVYEYFLKLKQDDHKRFLLGIKKLMGYSSSDLFQVTCYYEHKEERYQFIRVDGSHAQEISWESFELVGPREGNSFFEICFEKVMVRVRVKPMNKFTVPGFKLNISLTDRP